MVHIIRMHPHMHVCHDGVGQPFERVVVAVELLEGRAPADVLWQAREPVRVEVPARGGGDTIQHVQVVMQVARDALAFALYFDAGYERQVQVPVGLLTTCRHNTHSFDT